MSSEFEQMGLFESFEIEQRDSPENLAMLEELAVRIARENGLKIKTVKWKNNRQVMASVGKGGVLNLNLIYRNAVEKDIEALVQILNGTAGTQSRNRFHGFIEKHLPAVMRDESSRLRVLHPQGMFHDLNAALDIVLNLLDEPLRPMPLVGWSPALVGRRQITWGTHRNTPSGPLILVNAVLDDFDIPNYVVEHILWHELCHQIVPPGEGTNGRRLIHGSVFKKMEKRYPRIDEAEKWETKNLTRLLKKHR